MQQKTKTETEPHYKRFFSNRKVLAAIAALVVIGIGPSQAAFAYKGPSEKQESTDLVDKEWQSLATSLSAEEIPIPLEVMEVELAPEPEPEPVVAAAAPAPASAPLSYNGGGILAAARSQIGWAQDCTALVENSLRMLGYSVGDLGPMDFGRYGVSVPHAEAQPGDIMMRPGHVAIYSGGGMAIHGGVPAYGGTVEFQYSASPYEYSVIIRLQ